MEYPKYPMYKCPVCNFKGLNEPAYDSDGDGSYDICPCCGFEFGLHDFDYPTKEEAHDAWRKKWIKNRYEWHADCDLHLKPKDWDPIKQLEGLEESNKEEDK